MQWLATQVSHSPGPWRLIKQALLASWCWRVLLLPPNGVPFAGSLGSDPWRGQTHDIEWLLIYNPEELRNKLTQAAIFARRGCHIPENKAELIIRRRLNLDVIMLYLYVNSFFPAESFEIIVKINLSSWFSMEMNATKSVLAFYCKNLA